MGRCDGTLPLPYHRLEAVEGLLYLAGVLGEVHYIYCCPEATIAHYELISFEGICRSFGKGYLLGISY